MYSEPSDDRGLSIIWLDEKNISNPDAIFLIAKLMNTDIMQSLVMLSPHMRHESSYWSSGNITNISTRYTLEEWWEHCEKSQEFYALPHVRSFWKDIKVVGDALNTIDELRILWETNMIHNIAVIELFAHMLGQWKVALTDLVIEDGAMFWYTEFQMQCFMRSGMAVQAFSPEMKDKILDKLN